MTPRTVTVHTGYRVTCRRENMGKTDSIQHTDTQQASSQIRSACHRGLARWREDKAAIELGQSD